MNVFVNVSHAGITARHGVQPTTAGSGPADEMTTFLPSSGPTDVFQLALGAISQLPNERGAAAYGPQPLQRRSRRELRHGGFTPAADAGRDLTLRYHYEGPGGDALVPPYNEVRTVPIGVVAGGTRRRIELTVPSAQSAQP